MSATLEATAHLRAMFDRMQEEWPQYQYIWPSADIPQWHRLARMSVFGTEMSRAFIGLGAGLPLRIEVPGKSLAYDYSIIEVGVEVVTYESDDRTHWRVAPAFYSLNALGERNVTAPATVAQMQAHGARMHGMLPNEYNDLLKRAVALARKVAARWDSLDWDEVLAPAAGATRQRREMREHDRKVEEANNRLYDRLLRGDIRTRWSLRNTSGGQSGGTGAQVKRPAGLRKTTGEWLEVVPAFGRDYTTAAEAKSAWYSGKDWKGASRHGPIGERLINLEQAQEDNFRVILRFDGGRKTTGT